MKGTKFYKRISVLLISVLFIACFSLIIFAQEVLADDIGLKVYKGTEGIPIDVVPAGSSTSPLRIAKGGNIYSIVLVNPGDPNESGLRIQTTNSGIKSLRKYVPLPTAYVSMSFWAQLIWMNSFRVFVYVTVRENTSSGPPLAGVTVQGTWSGAYNASVSGVTDANGQVTWIAPWVGVGQLVIFTVTSITKDGDVYELDGTLSGSTRP